MIQDFPYEKLIQFLETPEGKEFLKEREIEQKNNEEDTECKLLLEQILGAASAICERKEYREFRKVKLERARDFFIGDMTVCDYVVKDGEFERTNVRTVPRDCCDRCDQDQYEKPEAMKKLESAKKASGKAKKDAKSE